MTIKQLVLVSCAALAFGVTSVQAGPCNTTGMKSAQDAGSGPTVGNTGQTTGTGSANTTQHPPTARMNSATDNVATSSQDAQRQMQGKPTASQQAQGVESSAKMDQGC